MTLVIGYENVEWTRRYTVPRLWRIDRLPPVPMIAIDHRHMRDDAVPRHEFVTNKVAERTAHH